MGTAWTYATDPNAEYDAVWERVGMFDMSPLKKVFVRGRASLKVVDHVITRDGMKIANGQSAYDAALTESGTVCDDTILANCGDGEWMLAHGSGKSMERLLESVEGHDYPWSWTTIYMTSQCRVPLRSRSRAPVRESSSHPSRIFTTSGQPCSAIPAGSSGPAIPASAATRYSRGDVICDIWDRLAAANVMPCSFTALDKVRIEVALLFFGYDMTPEHTPWEVGLGFTVNLNKPDYRGKSAGAASKGMERFVLAGIVADHTDMLNEG